MNEIENYNQVGIKKTEMNLTKTFLKAILAGSFIALASVCSIVISAGITNISLAKALQALVFPIGLILVVLFKTELFTGNCLLIIPLANHKITGFKMLKNLITVYIGNLVGALLIVMLITCTNHFQLANGLFAQTTINIANTKSSLSFVSAFTLGILCNILVCAAVFLATNSKTMIEKIMSCIFPIFMFILLGFEHSVANMYYLFAGLFAQTETLSEQIINIQGIINNLIPVTLGNIFGGFILGLILNKTNRS